MTKMAAIFHMVKTEKKVFVSRTSRSMTLKIGMMNCVRKCYRDCSNNDPG